MIEGSKEDEDPYLLVRGLIGILHLLASPMQFLCKGLLHWEHL